MSQHEEADGKIKLLEGMADTSAIACASLYVPDAEDALSPWEAPAVFGKKDFGAGAAATLRSIEQSIIPKLRSELPGGKDTLFVLEGYSLAGLFALWSGYTSGAFAAVCGVSPSVWYPDWITFAETRAPKTDFMYLSLGKNEKKTRNQRMCKVEECIVRQSEIARKAMGEDACILEFNEGGHFNDVPLRRAKAMAACIRHLIK